MQMESVHFPATPIALKMAVAIGIGMLVGMEREWSNKDVGVRSFAIVALLGMLASIIGLNVVIASLIGVLLLIAAMNARSILTDRSLEITTSAALIVNFLLGVLVGLGHIFTPIAGAIVMTMLLAWKTELSRFAGGLQPLPINHRIQIEEGSGDFNVKPFALSPRSWAQAGDPAREETLPQSSATWLIEPIPALDFSLPDTSGHRIDLHSLRERFVLLTFWTTDSAACRDQLQRLRQAQRTLADTALRLAAVNLDSPPDPAAIKSFARKAGLAFLILLGTEDVAGLYNIVYRYLFDRHRDLPLPTSFLIDPDGSIVRVYQGSVTA